VSPDGEVPGEFLFSDEGKKGKATALTFHARRKEGDEPTELNRSERTGVPKPAWFARRHAFLAFLSRLGKAWQKPGREETGAEY